MHINIYRLQHQRIQRDDSGEIIHRGAVTHDVIGAETAEKALALIPQPAGGENLLVASDVLVHNVRIAEAPKVAVAEKQQEPPKPKKLARLARLDRKAPRKKLMGFI